MIFPDISPDKWCNKYNLEIKSANCSHCGNKKVANIPFIESEWVGLTSNNCKCGSTAAYEIRIARPGTKSFLTLEELFQS